MGCAAVVGMYICFLTFVTGWSYLHPGQEWDMIGYMAVIASWHTTSPTEIHNSVYGELHRTKTPAAYDRLIGGPGGPHSPGERQRLFRQNMATNPFHLTEELPFYSIKPLYFDLVWLVHITGLPLDRSMQLISALSALGLGLLSFLWISIYLGDVRGAAVSALLCLTVPVYLLARLETPDALNTLVLAIALYLVFEKKKLFPGLALLCISPLIRPDSAILSLVVLLYLSTLAPTSITMRKAHATALVATVEGATLAAGRFGGSYGCKVLFANTFRPPLLNPGEISPVVTPANYLAVLRSSFGRFMYGDLALLSFFVVLVLRGAKNACTTS